MKIDKTVLFAGLVCVLLLSKILSKKQKATVADTPISANVAYIPKSENQMYADTSGNIYGQAKSGFFTIDLAEQRLNLQGNIQANVGDRYNGANFIVQDLSRNNAFSYFKTRQEVLNIFPQFGAYM